MLTHIKNNNLNYKANLKSPKLKLKQEDFFIKIKGYGRNRLWANQIVKTTDFSVDLIQRDTALENVLKLIVKCVIAANKIPFDIQKRLKTGILRTERENWKSTTDDIEIKTAYETGRYSIYKDRVIKIQKEPLKPIKEGIGLSKPDLYEDISHAPAKLINNSLDYIFDLYKNKYSKFLKKDVKKENLKDIIDVVAEIRWVLAHATPWLRGSDAISNVLMRAMFKAVGVKAYPPAKNISYDFEAYCRNLEDYKENFNSFFEKPLEVIE